ncbi:ROK family transcriptional regulator [Halalkalibacterium halodurans]|uniref:Transcriptional repressor of the xylose operon n=1 Tax=Halalkalibacterium halodurans (strain ATCC BAA-125 / DSM 18197 / FERM 7344 / JCM 9153 / C-125) TaxID=272558 RepID=Q9KEZ9_HALH5|nr:ROK family transcriptional regulator [Halalkalibacterium halodurans]MDY7221191.1 ROK family transcriptional regulator [Halalkalibacterium halodurans]MDY7240430.1 ROK family transcriptional regulator [Halalkalibacterium halodurans]MED4080326.1 ROK family transcriptional regulator [Halalkalibacterium halodurans]MED4084610.1 ROK family transcriptional regulator [Halalkalibacterium halodurans]MED4104826.1 ROK family transcriptional regulator [Halalkalibacterium halodurans]
MDTRGATFIKKMNRRAILEKIIEKQEISRSDLSKITNLNKVTVSSQVASLLEEHLIIEKQYAESSGGRKPILLTLNENAAFTLGIDLDIKTLTFMLCNLKGAVIKKEQWKLANVDFDDVVNEMISLIQSFLKDIPASKYGVVGIGIGIHGIVDNDETIAFTPGHHWSNVNVKQPIEQAVNIPVVVENSTNLCALAENVVSDHEADNLLCISSFSGVGMGLIVHNAIYKGFHGYAGEVGHMIIVPEGKPCRCGNKGCWELYASEKALYQEISESTKREHVDRDVVLALIEAGDEETLKKLDQFIYYFSLGLNNIINSYNPETIVISSGLMPHLPNIEHKIQSHLHSKISHYKTLKISNLGKEACALGACFIGIKQFLEINTLKLSATKT